MTWRATNARHFARHVIDTCSAPSFLLLNGILDVASNFWQAVAAEGDVFYYNFGYSNSGRPHLDPRLDAAGEALRAADSARGVPARVDQRAGAYTRPLLSST